MKALNTIVWNIAVQAMLFLNFSDDRIEAFKSQIQDAAKKFSANNISFLIGDVEAADRAFQVVIHSFSEHCLS